MEGVPDPKPLFDDPVLIWRFDKLFEAGFTTEQAVLLAGDPRVDFHRALAMVAAGCPYVVVTEILR